MESSQQKPKGSYSSGKKKRKPHYEPPEDGSPPTPEQVEKLMTRGTNYCEWWLGQSDKSEQFLRDKLAGKGYPEDIIDRILDKLREYGYVDDVRYAHQYVRNRQEYDRRGTNAIKFELMRKGISREIIDEALEEEKDDDVQREAALSLARSKARSSRNVDKQKRVQRIVGALARRGYDLGMAFSIAKEALAEDDEEMDLEEPVDL